MPCYQPLIVTTRKPAHLKGYEQLHFDFRRGSNLKPPRLRTVYNGARRPHTRWEAWCGWCRKDHAYPKRYPIEVVINTHRDRMEHDCMPKALETEGLA
jgi:hypothetical protein